MTRDYHKWFSPSLRREMELLVFGHGGPRVIVFPTREGRFFDYENWGLIHALSPQINAGGAQLFCVDSVDSEGLYGWGMEPRARIARHNEYEQYILNEVVPLTRSTNSHPDLVAHGCSIGAYHAVNTALRHPAVFRRVVALSGRYDLTQPVGAFPDLFSGHYDTDIYFHTPNHFLPNLQDAGQIRNLRNMDVALAVGECDPFRESNSMLSRSLVEKGIAHRLDFWDGEAHRAKYWREMLPRYF